MRALISSKRPELRGSLIGLAMLVAAAIVFGGIVAIVLVQETWVVVAAVVLEIAVIIGGVIWVMPILADREETGEPGAIGSDLREDDDNVVSLRTQSDDSAEPERRGGDHTPKVAA